MPAIEGRWIGFSPWDEGAGLHILEGDEEDPQRVGHVQVDIVKDNVVVTVERIDESKFGPVSLVVV